jgi:Tfp pilus assembly protein PilF
MSILTAIDIFALVDYFPPQQSKAELPVQKTADIQTQWRAHLVYIILCLLAGCAVPVQRFQHYVDGKPVSEEVYRATRFYNDALPLIEANRLAEARIKLMAAVRLAPDFYAAHYDLGLVLRQLGREQDALQHFKTIVIAKADLPLAWLSLGTMHMDAGNDKEAIAVFTDAFSRFSETTWQRAPEFYYNFGTALGKVGRTDEGIEKLKLALRADSEMRFAWMNLGLFYQARGKLPESIAHYREFIKRFPADADAPMIVDAIKVLEAELREASAIQRRSEHEYYAEVTRTQPGIWPRVSMPLRVYIHPGDGTPGFQPRFNGFLQVAFQDWVNASEGRVSVRFVDQPSDADIECVWTSDPSRLRNRAEGGEAQVYVQDGVILKAMIIILTVPVNRMNPVTENLIRTVALHEVGHALGLLGHSPKPEDVMFFSAGITDSKPELSARDRKTLVRLYSQD